MYCEKSTLPMILCTVIYIYISVKGGGGGVDGDNDWGNKMYVFVCV